MAPSSMSRNNAPTKLRRLVDLAKSACLLNHIDRYAPRIRAGVANLISALSLAKELFREWKRLEHRARWVARVAGRPVPQSAIERAEQDLLNALRRTL
jgi:hypothetical protein